eukprot:5518230-Lingulodinium_polyedra.AAC.1
MANMGIRTSPTGETEDHRPGCLDARGRPSASMSIPIWRSICVNVHARMAQRGFATGANRN